MTISAQALIAHGELHKTAGRSASCVLSGTRLRRRQRLTASALMARVATGLIVDEGDR